jgi:uncharacterized protein (DUF2236 family)
VKAARLRPSSIFPPPPAPGVPGDPGLVPGDVVWSLARERLIVLGGPAALCLQAMHPLLAAGVADHSAYRGNTHGRLLNTLQAVLTVTFGDTAQGQAMGRRVTRRHQHVNGRLGTDAGTIPAGTRYDATDPELGLWVHATLVYSALEVERRYFGRFDDADRAAYYEQMKDFAHAFGVSDEVLPATYAEFTAVFARTLDGLVLTDEARRIGLDVLYPRFAPPLPGAGHLTRVFTADLLPARVRESFGLRHSRFQAIAFRLFVRAVRPLVPGRLAFWPHYHVAVARLAAPFPVQLPRGPQQRRTAASARAEVGAGSATG